MEQPDWQGFRPIFPVLPSFILPAWYELKSLLGYPVL
jgi:hypothetical protein